MRMGASCVDASYELLSLSLSLSLSLLLLRSDASNDSNQNVLRGVRDGCLK